jgi:hypothetical protein
MNCLTALAQHPPITSAFIRANVLLESLQALEDLSRARKHTRLLSMVGFLGAAACCEEGQNFLAKNMGPSSFAMILDLLTLFGPSEFEDASSKEPLAPLPATFESNLDDAVPSALSPFVSTSLAKARTKGLLPTSMRKHPAGKPSKNLKASETAEKATLTSIHDMTHPSPPAAKVLEQGMCEEMLSALVRSSPFSPISPFLFPFLYATRHTSTHLAPLSLRCFSFSTWLASWALR